MEPFIIKDCTLVSIATGIKAQNLKEFRDGLVKVHSGSIYHHFWGRLLQPHFDEPEYNNDFASWVYHKLHDQELAEQLSVLSPTEFKSIEALRQELIDIVEIHLDENEFLFWTRADQQFHFVRSQVLVLDTGRIVDEPKNLAAYLKGFSIGSIYYHFIDARRRTKKGYDDFSAWLDAYGEEFSYLREKLSAIDPFFSSLEELRSILIETLLEFFED